MGSMAKTLRVPGVELISGLPSINSNLNVTDIGLVGSAHPEVDQGFQQLAGVDFS